MAEKFSVKALKELPQLGATTAKSLKEYAQTFGMMDSSGNITEAGLAHLEYRSRKYDNAPYLAASEEFARTVRASILDKIDRKYNLK